MLVEYFFSIYFKYAMLRWIFNIPEGNVTRVKLFFQFNCVME